MVLLGDNLSDPDFVAALSFVGVFCALAASSGASWGSGWGLLLDEIGSALIDTPLMILETGPDFPRLSALVFSFTKPDLLATFFFSLASNWPLSAFGNLETRKKTKDFLASSWFPFHPSCGSNVDDIICKPSSMTLLTVCMASALSIQVVTSSKTDPEA